MPENHLTSEIVLQGQIYPYHIRRSKRARHILLHVDTQQGIELVIPQRGSATAAREFLIKKQAWVLRVLQRQRALKAQVPRRQLVTGDTLPLLGETYQLVVALDPKRKRGKVTESSQTLTVLVPSPALARPLIVKWYKARALDYFSTLCEAEAARLNLRPLRIGIRQPKTQWGSCSGRGALSFNWRLMLAPAAVARYVGVHEVAHLRYRNHSPRFWGVVARLEPEFERARAWLKTRGHTLVL